MHAEPYIARQLSFGRDAGDETELLRKLNGVVIVLAEPGAGKSRLLKRLGEELGAKPIRASIFDADVDGGADALVIDALDEVARLDSSKVAGLLLKIRQCAANKVIIATRSAQWNQARGRLARDVFGEDPVEVRIAPLSQTQQRDLYQAKFGRDDFNAFRQALAQIDLDGLLGNPQFLLIFASAYVSRGGVVTTKSKVFHDAVLQLATEWNDDLDIPDRPQAEELTQVAGEVFATLLLSGASGICVKESHANRHFPFMSALSRSKTAIIQATLDCGLFKASDHPDQHEPVHRIIAEYAAASYLSGRLCDPGDRLSITRCFALIAPNGAVREDLKGLLAWMGALGSPEVAQKAIALDSYSVLSGGDPARLNEHDKTSLLTALGKLAEDNPYFRGADIWRSFSAAGFFTASTVSTVQKLIRDADPESQLVDLLLELVHGADIAQHLTETLCHIIQSSDYGLHTRSRAALNLCNAENQLVAREFDNLLLQESPDAIATAAHIMEECQAERLGKQRLLALTRAIDRGFFPRNTKRRRERSHYFIQRLMACFAEPDVTWLLDQLSEEADCACGAKHSYNCECREGRSYLIGRLLDRFFDLGERTPIAIEVWRWTRHLNFRHERNAKESASVRALNENDTLRQEVQRLAFSDVHTRDEIFDRSLFFRLNESHSGLGFAEDDVRVLICHAFESDNVVLWSQFISYPKNASNDKQREPVPLRTLMRSHGHSKPAFMQAWVRENRCYAQQVRKMRDNYGRRLARRAARRERQQREVKEKNQRHFEDHRQDVEQGRNWPWLNRFSVGYLRQDAKYYPNLDDPALPARALRRSFPFLREHMPTLETIATTNGVDPVVRSLYAGCLAEFREHGTLAGVDPEILRVAKTIAHAHYSGGSFDDRLEFTEALNQTAFPASHDAEAYLRIYLEPQLADPDHAHVDLHALETEEIFEPLRRDLPIEWLDKFEQMPLGTAKTLFDLAAAHGGRNSLLELIERRCDELNRASNQPERRDFWMLRKFFCSREMTADVESWLKETRDRVFMIHEVVERIHWNDETPLPTLSAAKTHAVLEIFAEQWPPVHLPDSWSTDDPPEQTAFRFLTRIIWRIGDDNPANSVPVLEAIIQNDGLSDFHRDAKVVLFNERKALALKDFEAPQPASVFAALQSEKPASVEDLRAYMLEAISEAQEWIRNGDTNDLSLFYEGDKRVGEVMACKRIVGLLRHRCNALGIVLTLEHELADQNRCDITARTIVDGAERMLVIEVKGQWHRDLYTAATAQLHERYAVHPSAEQQGIYLVLWFGADEKVANIKSHGISSNSELLDRIRANLGDNLPPFIDVAGVDLSPKLQPDA